MTASSVFVTGGAGFIGSHIASELTQLGNEVTVYDSFEQYIIPPSRSSIENLRYRFDHLLGGARIVRGNTQDKDHLRRAIAEADPEYVIHLAALPLAALAISAPEEALRSITLGTANVLDVVRDCKRLKNFVYVSSSMAYGTFTFSSQPESAPKAPIELYGALKLSAEVLVQTYGRLHDIPFRIVRPSSVYGPTDNNRRVVQIFVEAAIQGHPISVTDPDNTFLDFTYVTDTAHGLCLAALTDQPDGEDFNISCGAGRSLSMLLDLIRRRHDDLRSEICLQVDGLERPKRGTLDISKAKQLLGYEPRVSLEDGVDKYLDYVVSVNKSLPIGERLD